MKKKRALAQQQNHLFDKPVNVTRVIRGLLALCIILFALDFVLHRHSNHPWDAMPGFYALYGFIGCVLLVIIAKGLRRLLMRGPNYYQRKKQQGITEPQAADEQECDDVAP